MATTKSPSVDATTRDEQWTVCRDMIRGGSNGLRAHFTRATCPCSPQYRPAGCRSGEQTSRSRQSGQASRRRTEPPSRRDRARDLMLPALAPNNQPTWAPAVLPSVIGGPGLDFMMIDRSRSCAFVQPLPACVPGARLLIWPTFRRSGEAEAQLRSDTD